jgi:uncharacterized membrane protein
MSTSERISAAVAYLPLVGWIYAYFVQRKSELAMFHLRQSISLFGIQIAIFALWAVVAWVITWIPYGVVFSVALFSLVMSAFFVGVVAWLVGIVNALRGLMKDVPLFSGWASRLPI